ncbi:FdhF/YdeP family oxidoreductase [Salinimonas sediminis]|uniref:CbbBc protein n=1 Tax=Salinimonas sediminis TaxID=2303538 RepID=A0A346NQ51_9ALTE|nr:FdhF/YdeP family oxidoreductase [Salinimonas sediminis]AXR07658.1 CbbBc protein [Salinimonas sediminis]
MTDKSNIKSYDKPAGGWGALRSVTKFWIGSEKPIKNLRAMLKMNHHKGFDCPGCAWGESPESGMVKFCENGAKAVNWESTGHYVGPDFFAKHSVSALKRHTDYWLESQGRLTHPMQYNPATDHYESVSWEDAFKLVATHLTQLESPHQANFYTSGRASNEAAYLYQLFVRAYGTNNFPDCSNMCHEASGLGMTPTIGVGKGTVVFDDFAKADAIFVIGQNPGTNHPRMLEPLREAVRRGAQVVCFNPLKERGLERFQNPQHPTEMLSNGSEPTNTAYFSPALGGDMAVMRGIAKWLLTWEREAQQNNQPAIFDHEFLQRHTQGVDDYLAAVDATEWEQIEQQSGLSRDEIRHAAAMYCKAERVIMCWAMGITQHHHSVATVKEIVHVQLLRGNVGKPGAGLSPVRGHSNVQGDRTVGINEDPSEAFLNAMEERFSFTAPRKKGNNTIQAIQAMEQDKAKVFIGLGGNFAQATPDTPRTQEALAKCDLTVQISTKLNRSHLITGKAALILPCLGRTEVDMQASGQQGITVEDTFSMVHISHGQLPPSSPLLRSEPAIIAGMAKATLGDYPVNWDELIADYDRIRDLIADTIPGFADFNRKLQHPGGFHLGNAAAQRNWLTPSSKAQFESIKLPDSLLNADIVARGEKPDLILQTLRSHDQYNTTIYGMNDRYRSVFGTRHVLFVNAKDIERLGFKDGDKVDITSLWKDGKKRQVTQFMLVAYDTPMGQAAAYYPETNPLVPLESYGEGTFTPTSKFIAITLAKSAPDNRIEVAAV